VVADVLAVVARDDEDGVLPFVVSLEVVYEFADPAIKVGDLSSIQSPEDFEIALGIVDFPGNVLLRVLWNLHCLTVRDSGWEELFGEIFRRPVFEVWFEIIDEQEERQIIVSIIEPAFEPLVGLFCPVVVVVTSELSVDYVREIDDRIPVEHFATERLEFVKPLVHSRDAAEISVRLDVLPGFVELIKSASEPELLADPSVVRHCNSFVIRRPKDLGDSRYFLV